MKIWLLLVCLQNKCDKEPLQANFFMTKQSCENFIKNARDSNKIVIGTCVEGEFNPVKEEK